MSSNWERLQARLKRPGAHGAAEGSRSISEALAQARAAKAEAAAEEKRSAERAREAERGGVKAGALTRELGVDCEMVGAGPKDRSVLAQVCVINARCEVVYMTHVKPKEEVGDYRTWVSGVREQDLRHAPSFDEVRMHVGKLLDGRILVGHGLSNDLAALMLKHPRRLVRDTTKYPAFTRMGGAGRVMPRKLKAIAAEFLGMDIQTGEHDPTEDAVAAMRLYQLVRHDWERWVAHRVEPPPLVPKFAKTRQTGNSASSSTRAEVAATASSASSSSSSSSSDLFASARGARGKGDSGKSGKGDRGGVGGAGAAAGGGAGVVRASRGEGAAGRKRERSPSAAREGEREERPRQGKDGVKRRRE